MASTGQSRSIDLPQDRLQQVLVLLQDGESTRLLFVRSRRYTVLQLLGMLLLAVSWHLKGLVYKRHDSASGNGCCDQLV